MNLQKQGRVPLNLQAIGDMVWCENVGKYDFSHHKFIRDSKKISRMNVEMAFDIETTSTYIEDNKFAFMYIWMFGIHETIFYGRTWDQFITFIKELSSRLNTSIDRRIVIFVHNLQFEFQFIYKLFEWYKVFALKPHKPIYAVTYSGIEFRCSYLMSGLKLARLASNLTKHKVAKKEGDLDYEKVRHHETIIKQKEMGYCKGDIVVLLCYINEQISEHNNNINNIPFTNTGRVRNYCRRETLDRNYREYVNFIRRLTLNEDQYEQMKRAFQGGFTHANYYHVNKVIQNVESFDLASSYPSTMVCDLYPMTSPEEVSPKSEEEFDELLKKYACVFDVVFFDICETDAQDNIISESRCWLKKRVIVNNGRVVSADELGTTLTELDYEAIKKFYTWEKSEVTNMRIMQKAYLPKSLILSILNLYRNKTTLKDVAGKEIEYMRSKNMINSVYGMTVTDIARPEIIFQSTGLWKSNEVDLQKAMRTYNSSKRRFLFYPWGVWVTAYARRNLFSAIVEFGNDYIYSDTDSVKVVNAENHRKFIEEYNDNIRKKMYRMCDMYGIDRELIEPIAPNGKKKMLGIWEDEGTYEKFKTLGAKRYMIEKGGVVNITVSGVNKSTAVPYIVENFDDPFEGFEDGMYIPEDYTGKLTHTYIDDEMEADVTDYNGVTAHVISPSAVHLEKASYEMSLSAAYIDFLNGYLEDKE